MANGGADRNKIGQDLASSNALMRLFSMITPDLANRSPAQFGYGYAPGGYMEDMMTALGNTLTQTGRKYPSPYSPHPGVGEAAGSIVDPTTRYILQQLLGISGA